MNKSAAVLYSGGKDSTFAIHLLRELGYEVACLVSIISENPDSYMLHTANIHLVDLGSRALEIPLFVGRTMGKKEDELTDIKQSMVEARKKFAFDTIGCGGLASNYQKSRIEKIASEVGLDASCPLWEVNQKSYVKNLVRQDYHFILTSVSAGGLDQTWLGKEINEKAVDQLVTLSEKYSFNAALEGGEGETLVLDCPLFPKEKIRILESKKIWNGYQGKLEITKAELVPKVKSILQV